MLSLLRGGSPGGKIKPKYPPGFCFLSTFKAWYATFGMRLRPVGKAADPTHEVEHA